MMLARDEYFFLIILFVNLVMDGLGAIMLGNEPALPEYMQEKPRRRDESIISRKMAVQIGVMGRLADHFELSLPEGSLLSGGAWKRRAASDRIFCFVHCQCPV